MEDWKGCRGVRLEMANELTHMPFRWQYTAIDADK
jgi:hypothetical protein